MVPHFVGLRDRGPGGVRLVISDSHRSPTNAAAAVLQGAAWQRCRVHFMRNALARVGKGHAEMVAATIRTVFAQPTPDAVRAHVDVVADMLCGQFPAVADLLLDAKSDLAAYADFPHAHWRKIWSTNPLERLNKEVKRRTDVVGIFPNTEALLRLSACVSDRGPRRVAGHQPPQSVGGIHGPAEAASPDPAPAPTTRHRTRPRPRRRRRGMIFLSAEQHAMS